MNTIIVEDEQRAAASLQDLINRYCPEVKVCGVAASAFEARELLTGPPIDLIFLDIGLPRETGFEFLESLPEKNFLVIVVTGSHEHALRAIKASAVDYLLKPIHIEELRQAVSKALRLIELKKQYQSLSQNYQSSLNGLIRNLTKGERIQKITLPYQQGFISVSVDEIKYLKAEDNYTFFYLANDKSLLASRTLKDFEDALDDPRFVRVHKSFLINLDFLDRFDTSDSPIVVLEEDITIPVSRRRVKEFNEKWQEFSRTSN